MITKNTPIVVPPRVLDRFASESPYAADRPPQPIDLWLDLNEASDPDDAALAAIRSVDADTVRRYPDATSLERKVAARLNIEASRALATAGGDDAIDRVCRVMLDEARTLVTHSPGFSMIEASARRAGAIVRRVPWDRDPFPIEDFLDAIDDRTGVAALVSPNNPTGLAVRRDRVERIAARCAEVGAALLLDLAYAEFADEDPTGFALTLPNTAIVRTLSKAYGLAGLRVGFLLGDRSIVDACRAVGAPFAVSRPSVVAAAASLDEPAASLVSRTDRIRFERRALASHLRSLGADARDSQANFVLARFDSPARARWVRDALRGLGIALRAWPEPGDLAGALRITCPGDDRSFDRLLFAIRTALAPQAILLDLDGVLADVSRSYRAAILATCKSFGARVAPSEVGAMKARGNANNDWQVTRDLLALRGIAIDLGVVIERFESIYQGTALAPGLRETESLIGTLDTVRNLAARLPLAIVTGRPRADAERFLDRFGLTPFVSACVCMEDGPSKPDPAVVRLALNRLGVDRAWMVGDTVDDARAARAAGVVPVGVVAPQDDPGRTRDTLLRAGASRVLGSLADLAEMLQ